MHVATCCSRPALTVVPPASALQPENLPSSPCPHAECPVPFSPISHGPRSTPFEPAYYEWGWWCGSTKTICTRCPGPPVAGPPCVCAPPPCSKEPVPGPGFQLVPAPSQVAWQGWEEAVWKVCWSLLRLLSAGAVSLHPPFRVVIRSGGRPQPWWRLQARAPSPYCPSPCLLCPCRPCFWTTLGAPALFAQDIPAPSFSLAPKFSPTLPLSEVYRSHLQLHNAPLQGG